MGVYYTACTVVGIEIPQSACYTRSQTRDRGCEHPLPDGSNDPFCSRCGEKTWVESVVTEPLSLYDEDNGTFAGLDVIQDQYHDDARRFFVGTATTMDMQGGFPEMLPPGVVEETRQRLKAVLEPLDLWDEDKFGIWTFFMQYS